MIRDISEFSEEPGNVWDIEIRVISKDPRIFRVRWNGEISGM